MATKAEQSRAENLPEVLLVTKAGCGLCREMKRSLDAAAEQTAFAVRTHYIHSGDDGFHARFWDKVPVILIDGKEVFRYRAKIEDILAALRKRGPDSTKKKEGRQEEG